MAQLIRVSFWTAQHTYLLDYVYQPILSIITQIKRECNLKIVLLFQTKTLPNKYQIPIEEF